MRRGNLMLSIVLRGSWASTVPCEDTAVNPTIAQRLTAQTGIQSIPPSMTWYLRNAIVRVGSTAVALGLTEFLPTPEAEPQISDEEFVQLLETAVAKVNVDQ